MHWNHTEKITLIICVPVRLVNTIVILFGTVLVFFLFLWLCRGECVQSVARCNLEWFKCSPLLLMPYEFYKDDFYIGERRYRGELIWYQYASLILNVCQTRSPFLHIHFRYMHIKLCELLYLACVMQKVLGLYTTKASLFFTKWRPKKQWCSWYICISFSIMVA